MSTAENREEIYRLKKAMKEAEAIVIGAGAGLSTSAGFIYTGERLEKYFGDFVQVFSIRDMYSGGFMAMEMKPEVMWAYWSRYIYINRYMDPPRPVYTELFELVQNKDYFVITTNVDHCFRKAGFSKERLFYTQGDYGLFQCSRPCHKKTYDNAEIIKKMVLAQGFNIADDGSLAVPEDGDIKMEVPLELIPRCPICGEPMTLNLRADNTFVEDDGWEEASRRYHEFLRTRKNENILFLEVGVGYNTPGIIKVPFIRMTMELSNAMYACLNMGEAFAPDEIKEKSIIINADIGDTLEQLIK